MIHRLEEFKRDTLQVLGKRQVVIYRDQTVPLIDLSEIIGLNVHEPEEKKGQDPVPVFVVMLHERYVAFSIREIKDVCHAPLSLDVAVRDRDEIAGTADINGRVVSVLDIFSILDKAGILKTFDPRGILGKYAHGANTATQISPLEARTAQLENNVNSSESPASLTGDGWGLF